MVAFCAKSGYIVNVMGKSTRVIFLGKFWMYSTCSNRGKTWSKHLVYSKCARTLPTGYIGVIFLGIFKMCPFVCGLGSLESHCWAHWKYTQHVPTGHIGVTWQGIFKMYSKFNHWAHWNHMLTVLSMFSPCTQWVFGPLSPVTGNRAIPWVRPGN